MRDSEETLEMTGGQEWDMENKREKVCVRAEGKRELTHDRAAFPCLTDQALRRAAAASLNKRQTKLSS